MINTTPLKGEQIDNPNLNFTWFRDPKTGHPFRYLGMVLVQFTPGMGKKKKPTGRLTFTHARHNSLPVESSETYEDLADADANLFIIADDLRRATSETDLKPLV